jgi:hypothetical protein
VTRIWQITPYDSGLLPLQRPRHNSKKTRRPDLRMAVVWWLDCTAVSERQNDNSIDSIGANYEEHLKEQWQNMHCGTTISGAMRMNLRTTSMTLGPSLRKTGGVPYA